MSRRHSGSGQVPVTTDPDSHLQPPGNQPPAGTAPPPVMDQAFDRESLYLLRASLAARARKAGLPPARVDTVVIAVHELAANAVRHGAGHGRLRVWQHHQALHCEISDDGVPRAAGTGSDGAAPPGAPPWHAVPGHGLWLAHRLADHASLQTGPDGTVATVSFALRPGPRIGFIGVGRMGLPMCVNLARARYTR
jgi:anti-sigma regulatory factor (Ser/Thr protein kinase)